MSDKCGNCDCADSSQCTRRGNKMDDVIFVAAEKSYTESIVMDVASAENDGCKCGANCSCTDCTCGH
uniref:Metallothionein MT3 n=1 Tax=Ipomoea aquatica TaxID=89636 RepID=A0A3Q9U3J3_IPOAQ|nr:metallothionein MT3 [Ipomoea aquatica]